MNTIILLTSGIILTVVIIIINKRIIKYHFINDIVNTYNIYSKHLSIKDRQIFNILFFNILFYRLKRTKILKKSIFVQMNNSFKILKNLVFDGTIFENVSIEQIREDCYSKHSIITAIGIVETTFGFITVKEKKDAINFKININKTFIILKEDLYYLLTVFLGFIFLVCQGLEYIQTPFHINDSVYGSAFYMLTGLHGLHVIVGVLFLSVFFIRKQYYMSTNLLGLEFSAWYWHFVDVVWIFLYFVIYIGSYISGTLF